jgi:hypothetical protein
MGIVITWSLVFWIIAAVIAVWAFAVFLRRVAYAIALDENAPDVPIHPRTPSPEEGTAEYPQATDEAFRKKIPQFGRRHSVRLDPPPRRSFFDHHRVADVAESWKQHGAAAFNKLALLQTGLSLQLRYRNGLKATCRILVQSGSFIFVKSGGFFRQLDRGRAFLGRRVRAIGALVFLAEPLIGRLRKVRWLFLRRLG